MKTKQLLILLGILVVLFVIVLVSKNPFSRYEKKGETKSLFVDFDKNNVVKIELTKPVLSEVEGSDETTVLTKDGDKWLVETMENYPADQEEVDRLLDKVSEFKTDRLASKNPEKQSKFEVDSSGIEAKLSDSNGKVLAHLFVGKSDPVSMITYVREADSNEVYRVVGYLNPIFDKGERTWKDRTIFDFNKGNITQLTIESEEGKVILPKDEEGNWKIIEPKPANAKKEEVDKIADTLSKLEVSDFAEKKELKEYGLYEPKSKISAMLNDGSTKTLLIGNKEDSKYYVKRADSDIVFILYKYRIDELLKKFEDLKEESEEEE